MKFCFQREDVYDTVIKRYSALGEPHPPTRCNVSGQSTVLQSQRKSFLTFLAVASCEPRRTDTFVGSHACSTVSAAFFNYCCNKKKKKKKRERERFLLDKTAIRKFIVNSCCCCQVTSIMSDSVRPQRRQPTRLPRPWDSPGKNNGVGCHFLLRCMKVKVKSLSHVRLLATPQTAAYQAPPSMGFARQEYWSELPLPSPIVNSRVIETILCYTGNTYHW